MNDGTDKPVKDIVRGDKVQTDCISGVGIVDCVVVSDSNEYIQFPRDYPNTKTIK